MVMCDVIIVNITPNNKQTVPFNSLQKGRQITFKLTRDFSQKCSATQPGASSVQKQDANT